MARTGVWALTLCLLASLATASPPGAPRTAPKRRHKPPPPPLPQYFIQFGRCGHNLQKQEYGNWVVTRPRSKQEGPESIVLSLNTKNTTAVAKVFGNVEPLYFPIQHIYFGYFNKSGVRELSPALEHTGYKETPSYYRIRVNGTILTTIRDLKDNGTWTPESTSYSIKGSLNGAVRPSTKPYRVEIIKWCEGLTAIACSQIPDPATVFTSPSGHIVYSLWSVKQPLYVNGKLFQDHGWCPVQTARNVA